MARQSRTWPVLLLAAPAASAQAPMPSAPPAPKVAAVSQAPAAPWANKLFLADIARDPARKAPAEIAHDFGTVPQGAACSHTLRLTNVYDVPLQILDVRSSCSCLAADLPRKTLLPNESAAFTVSLDTSRAVGAVSHSLEVTVGPLHVSTAVLKFTAVSRPDVIVTPGRADFGTVPLGEGAKVRLALEYHGDQKEWKPGEVQVPNGPFAAAVVADPDAPAGGPPRYFVDVTLAKKGAKPGPIRGELLVRGAGGEPLRVPLAGAVRAPLDVQPPAVDFGTLKVGEPATFRVLVRAPGGLFRVDAEGDDELAVETFPAPAPVQVVTLRLTPAKPGPFRREVVLRSSRGGEVALPVEGVVEE